MSIRQELKLTMLVNDQASEKGESNFLLNLSRLIPTGE